MIKALLWLAILPVMAGAGDRLTGKNYTTRSEVIAQHGMAATSQPLAIQVAIDIPKHSGCRHRSECSTGAYGADGL